MTGLYLWSLTKTPVLECDHTWWQYPPRGLRCRAKTVMFFGTEPSDTEVEVNPVESVALVPATPASPSPFGQFHADSINHLRISGSNQLATIDIPLTATWHDADTLAAHLRTAIANPESPAVLVASPLGAIAIQLTHIIKKTKLTPIIISYPIPWQPYLPGLLVVVASLLYARKPGSWFEFDKANGMLTLKRHSLSPTLRYPIQAIQAIAIEEERFTSIKEVGEHQRSRLGYRVSLVLDSGQIEPLAKTYSANLSSKREAAEVIRTFLQLPPRNFQTG
ncbi:hypothetical protein JOY44_23030 [Phormidium sp. CLA17]|nr:hypothetical protein [Leptolyngbya sp. Cla-17]